MLPGRDVRQSDLKERGRLLVRCPLPRALLPNLCVGAQAGASAGRHDGHDPRARRLLRDGLLPEVPLRLAADDAATLLRSALTFRFYLKLIGRP